MGRDLRVLARVLRVACEFGELFDGYGEFSESLASSMEVWRVGGRVFRVVVTPLFFYQICFFL